MTEIADIEPCALSLPPKRSWLPGSPRLVHIDGTATGASMTAGSARLFQANRLDGAMVASSKTLGYWIYEGSGFKAPIGTVVGEIADAFDRNEAEQTNIRVEFS